MRQERTFLLLVVVTVMLAMFFAVRVVYAVEENTLKISDNVIVPGQRDFNVAFNEEPSYIGDGIAILNLTGDTTATMDITGLENIGDSVTAIFTIENTSNDIYADISASVANTNTEYFNVTATLSETRLEPKTGKTILKITTELIKLPIDKEEANISINIVAKPNYK